jgi:hypothetical protein
MQERYLDIYDLLLSPFYFILILYIAYYYKNTKLRIYSKKHYKYFLPALVCKIFGSICVCLIYTYYYDGGDVINYYSSTKLFVNVLLEGHIGKFFDMLDYKHNNINYILSSENIYGEGLAFSPNDYYALFTVMLTIPICLIACKSLIVTSMILASLSFIGLWRLYEVFIDQFPQLTREFAYAIFFVPSVFFWGSGILKDTYTFSAIGFYVYGLYNYQILKKRNLQYLIMMISAIIIFIYIKPYFFFALLPGSLIWIFFNRIKNIKNQVLAVMIIPLLLLTTLSMVLFLLNNFGEYLGEYSLDNVLDKAVKTQQDLIREQYGGNSYNIGEFEPTLEGILLKAPAALNLAFFRPYIWDARNPVMLLSGLENLLMLGFSLYILIKVKFSTLIKSLFSHPLLIFSLLFAVFFAFSVGLTTANYGALARLKIPCIPFYVSSLFILYHLNRKSFSRR